MVGDFYHRLAPCVLGERVKACGETGFAHFHVAEPVTDDVDLALESELA